MERTNKLLRKHGFIVIEQGYDDGFPSIVVKTTPESCILMSKRLQDILVDHHVGVKNIQNNPWIPQIQTVFDPAANHANIYIYGIDDDVVIV